MDSLELELVRAYRRYLEHLSGRHNQKSHGNKYGSADAIRGNVKRLGGDKAALKSMAKRARGDKDNLRLAAQYKSWEKHVKNKPDQEIRIPTTGRALPPQSPHEYFQGVSKLIEYHSKNPDRQQAAQNLDAIKKQLRDERHKAGRRRDELRVMLDEEIAKAKDIVEKRPQMAKIVARGLADTEKMGDTWEEFYSNIKKLENSAGSRVSVLRGEHRG